MEEHHLGAVDYAVFGASLVIPTVMGIWFRYSRKRYNTTHEYLMAGRDVSMLPVVLSATVTFLSSAAMISGPAEIYRYGFTKVILIASGAVGTVVAGYVFIPVYFECGVSTVYEFLEMRYGKKLRYMISALFILQMLLYSGAVLFGPVLALSGVTDFSPESSIIVIGLVCTFYSTMGGLRAILWTDVFQTILIFTCVIALCIKSIPEAGGIEEVFRKSYEGKRLDMWNFSPDMTVRYTFWGVVIKGFFMGLIYYGTNQAQVQRSFSLRTYQKAKSSVMWTALSSFILLSMLQLLGLLLYGVFYSCDPVLDGENTGLKKYDQMVPYYIVTRFSSTPGLTGLCVAGLFSGSLSSISSAVNAASMVTLMDFVKPIFTQVTERRAVFLAKLLSAVYGILSIGLTFAVSKTDSLLATVYILLGIVDGPILAIFLIAVLTKKANEKCALIGLVFGVLTSSWIGIGSLLSGYRHPALPLSTSGCPSQISALDVVHNATSHCPGNNTSCLSTTAPHTALTSETFVLYRISFVWVSSIGFCVSLISILSLAWITGWKNAVADNSKYLSPVTRLWIKPKTSERNQHEFTSGILLEKSTLKTIPVQKLLRPDSAC